MTYVLTKVTPILFDPFSFVHVHICQLFDIAKHDKALLKLRRLNLRMILTAKVRSISEFTTYDAVFRHYASGEHGRIYNCQ